MVGGGGGGRRGRRGITLENKYKETCILRNLLIWGWGGAWGRIEYFNDSRSGSVARWSWVGSGVWFREGGRGWVKSASAIYLGRGVCERLRGGLGLAGEASL